MKTIIILFSVVFFLFGACKSKSENTTKKVQQTKRFLDTPLDGIYVGLENMDYSVSPSEPEMKWFHLSYLKIKGDSVYLDQSPIALHKKDTAFSASDGGFYYYSGKVVRSDSTMNLTLKEIFCDYCAEPVKENKDGTFTREYRTKTYAAKLMGAGFVIDGHLFSKTTKKQDLISEHPEPFLQHR